MKGHILIVEDEVDLREILASLLEEHADQVLQVGDGVEALEIIKNNRVHAILTDINMPKKTGLQFLAEIRKAGIEIPVVIMSGYGDRVNTIEALRLGALDFFDKPVRETVLVEVMQRALKIGLGYEHLKSQLEILSKRGEQSPQSLQNWFDAKKSLYEMVVDQESWNKKNK
ncbi:MAG: response regulator [Pseudobdellovibrionaceae bacterium]